MKKAEVFIGSGSVFADLGLPNPEERQLKAYLIMEIDDAIRQKKLSKKQAAQKLELSLHDLVELLKGALSQFSINQLVDYLHCLGREVTLSASVRERGPKAKESAVKDAGVRKEPAAAV